MIEERIREATVVEEGEDLFRAVIAANAETEEPQVG